MPSATVLVLTCDRDGPCQPKGRSLVPEHLVLFGLVANTNQKHQEKPALSLMLFESKPFVNSGQI